MSRLTLLPRWIRVSLMSTCVVGVAYAAITQLTPPYSPPKGSVAVTTPQGALQRFALTSAAPSQDLTFFYNGGTGFVFDFIRQDTGSATLTFIDPTGKAVSPRSVADVQEFTVGTDAGANAGIPTIASAPGIHLAGTLQTTAQGKWTARITSAAPPASGGLSITATGTGAYQASSSAGSPDRDDEVVVQGQTAVVLAQLSKQGQPAGVTGVQAQATISSSVLSAPVMLALRDDGVAPDLHAADGIYVGTLPTATPGTFVVDTVFNAADGAILAQTNTSYVVQGNVGKLIGVTDAGPTDTDGDGLANFFTLPVGIEAAQTGHYDAVVNLLGSNGKEFVASGTAQVIAGVGSIPVQVVMQDLKATIGVEGPYTIRLASASFIPDDRTVPLSLGTLENLGQTQAYSFNSFQRPPLIVIGLQRDSGIDNNADGFFDALTAEFKVNSLNAGTYS